jgi:hypothetical protein
MVPGSNTVQEAQHKAVDHAVYNCPYLNFQGKLATKPEEYLLQLLEPENQLTAIIILH